MHETRLDDSPHPQIRSIEARNRAINFKFNYSANKLRENKDRAECQDWALASHSSFTLRHCRHPESKALLATVVSDTPIRRTPPNGFWYFAHLSSRAKNTSRHERHVIDRKYLSILLSTGTRPSVCSAPFFMLHYLLHVSKIPVCILCCCFIGIGLD